MKHVHAAMIIEWANDATKKVEWFSAPEGAWRSDPMPIWDPYIEYRLKPKTVLFNGEEIVPPLKPDFEFRHNQPYYYLVNALNDSVEEHEWVNDVSDNHWLNLGLVHLTREDAQAHLDAMLKPFRKCRESY
jgi:hypothetical protein